MGLSLGTRLGAYEVIGRLGAGGMGEAYRARDTRPERTPAIKILNSQLTISGELHTRFGRAAKVIAQLQHPQFRVLQDVGRDDTAAFLIMEFLEGESLDARLKKGSSTQPIEGGEQLSLIPNGRSC